MVVDSKKEQLEFEDIVKISLKETKSDYRLPVAFVSVMKELTLPGAWSVRMGNTVFIVHPQKDKVGYVFFRALNADTAKNYVEHSKKFTNQMRDKGYKVMVTQFQDPTILNIFKAIARDKPEGMGYAVQKSKDGKMYQVTVQLVKEQA
jgi:hypothetical protein